MVGRSGETHGGRIVAECQSRLEPIKICDIVRTSSVQHQAHDLGARLKYYIIEIYGLPRLPAAGVGNADWPGLIHAIEFDVEGSSIHHAREPAGDRVTASGSHVD